MTKQRSFMLKIKERIAVVLLGGSLLGVGVASSSAHAQDMLSSPLSRYGYGTLADRSPVAWRGMGGVGIGMNSNKVINLKNPAAYASSDSLSFLFDIGASVNMGYYRDNANRKTTFLGGLDYVAMQFPVFRDRIAVSLGLVPFSRAGYGLSTLSQVQDGSSTSQVVQSYKGSGSMQSAYFGIGGRVFGGLYLGTNIRYLFGSLTHSYTSIPNDVYGGTIRTSYGVKLSDISLDFGAQYRILLNDKDKDNLLIGVTYTPQFRVHPKLAYVVNRSTSSNSGSGSTIIRPDITTTTSEPVGALPHQMGAGFSWNRTDRYTLAVDFSTALWSRVPNIFAADGVGLRDTYNVGAGMEIKPDLYSHRYVNRISYRFGLSYGTSYMNMDKVGRIQTFGASVGLGLPIDLYTSERSSMVNLSLEYLHTMPQQAKLFSEDMLKLSMSITFNETWFRKLKIY